jgi:hypothetical protein
MELSSSRSWNAARSAAGQLDYWIKERNEWWVAYAIKTDI